MSRCHFPREPRLRVVFSVLHQRAIYEILTGNSQRNFLVGLTQDVLMVLWDERRPVLRLRFVDIDVDETVSRSIQVGVEREHVFLIGDVRILSLKVVNQFDPRQQAWSRVLT